MTDKNFNDLCDTLYGEIEAILEARELDYENNGDIIEITTDDEQTIIISKQPPLSQVWLASRQGGHHYHHTDGKWLDTRDGTEFIYFLKELL